MEKGIRLTCPLGPKASTPDPPEVWCVRGINVTGNLTRMSDGGEEDHGVDKSSLTGLQSEERVDRR